MNTLDQQVQTARALHQQGRLPEALQMFETILASRPDHVELLLRRGSVLFRMNRTDAAVASVDQALAVSPGMPEAFMLKGSIYGAAARYELSVGAYDRAVAIKPDLADAWFGRGNALAMQGRQADALESYRKALTLAPGHAEALAGSANMLSELGRVDEAIATYERALAIRPEMANGWLGRGNLFLNSGRLGLAQADFDQALRLDPNLAEAWLGRGIVEGRAQRYADALASLGRAVELKPGLAKAWFEAGVLLRELGRLGEAFGALSRSVELDPKLAQAWLEIGGLELKRRDHAAALSAYEKAATLGPDLPGVRGALLRARMDGFDWRNFESERDGLLATVQAGNPVLAPFLFTALSTSPEEQLRCARMWAWPADAEPVWKGERYGHEKLRVAYMSADFHEHPVAWQIAGMIELHDRSRFEITGLSLGPADESELRKRLQAGFDRFVDAAAMTDADIAALLRELEIDILVDLSGATEGGRARVLARRCAPIQVNYLGYPGTMGTTYHDYIIADRMVIPDAHRPHYSEKVAYLPNSYMVTDDKREISKASFTRAELGLPESGFVYCCFNNNFKITPAMFDIWMRILRAVDGSVLWLHERAMRGADRLRAEASTRGIDPARLLFAPRMPRLADHLARHRAADLFLDTIPFNAHVTAVDALWAGLPVLTLRGESFAGRVAASLLDAVGLPDLAVATAEDYERRAVELGLDGAASQALKQRLAAQRRATPLFATERFTRDIERAFTRMHERQLAGEAPDHIELPPSPA